MTSLFTVDGDRYVPTELSRGPWSADSLHGGPVAALLAHALESVPTATAMFPARFTLELWRAVGFAPLRIETEVVRPGRRVQVLEARLVTAAGDRGEGARDEGAGEGGGEGGGTGAADDGARVVARATLQQIEAAAVALPEGIEAQAHPPAPPPPPEEVPRTATGFDEATGGAVEPMRFDNVAVEHRASIPAFTVAGPATDWIRVLVDLVPGVVLSPFARVAAAADFGNGVSAALPWDRYLFVNPDLTIHLFRLPVDEWVHLDAATSFDLTPGAGGVAMAESVLSDRHGRLGRSIQSLYVAPV